MSKSKISKIKFSNFEKIKTKNLLYDIMQISKYGIMEDIKMNLYERITEKQRIDLKEADIDIENRDYSIEETKNIYSNFTSYIFNKSKIEIPTELKRYENVLQIITEK